MNVYEGLVDKKLQQLNQRTRQTVSPITPKRKLIMSTNEKKIKEQAETIVESIVALSLGKEPGMFSNSVFKSIADHPKYYEIRQMIVNHLQHFDGKTNTAEEWKTLSDFRFKLVDLYNNAWQACESETQEIVSFLFVIKSKFYDGKKTTKRFNFTSQAKLLYTKWFQNQR